MDSGELGALHDHVHDKGAFQDPCTTGIMSQSTHSDACIDNPNRLESYQLGKVLGRGSQSIVYLATCVRGRLNGRKVALKIIPPRPTSDREDLNFQAKLSLHHPALISVYSSFTISGSRYLVLELVDGGSLCELTCPTFHSGLCQTGTPSCLTEAQLRPVVRRITEGLLHLHAHGVVHGDIRPHNVLITGDGRIKLGGIGEYKSALTSDSLEEVPHTMLCGKRNYAAPEIRAGHGFSFASDLWSLGCLIVVILTGTCPLQASLESQHVASQSTQTGCPEPLGSYTFPSHLKLSPEVGDLTYGLLNIDPEKRISLQSVFAHPFFHPTLENQSLEEALIHLRNAETIERTSEYAADNIADDTATQAKYLPSMNSCPDNQQACATDQDRPKASSHSSLSSPSSATSRGMRDGLKKITLHKRSRGDGDKSPAKKEGLKRHTKALSEVGNIVNTPIYSDARDSCKKGVEENGPLGLLSPPETDFGKVSYVKQSLHGRSPLNVNEHVYAWRGDHHFQRGEKRDVLVGEHTLPVPRLTPPRALQVAPLLPQTYKVLHGQIIVTSSGDLLVDLRERERRHGKKGDYIMGISRDGRAIKVHEAPHLSMPCVLSEPQRTWMLDELPERYWESYNFASKYLESVKKRTPWMIWYTPQAKFVVMSNGPKGDIQASFPCPTQGRRYVSRNVADSITRMKIKVSRQEDTLKISSYTQSNGERGRGEWITKSETITEEQLKLGGDFMSRMTPTERQGLDCLFEGLKLVEAAEAIYMVARPHGPEKASKLEKNSDQQLKRDGT